MRRVLDWLDDRTGYRAVVRRALDEEVPGGASFAYVFGSVLTCVLVLQFTTGVFLAMYYSPSSTDAWASVAYIEDQVTLGWFVRGLHSYGASAIVILAGLHMLQTAVYGAYKKPRELNWIVGVFLLMLIMAFALTGYLLPWDQTGYWATKVATGIAGTTPLVGEQIQQAIQGGNEYGNLTLTRFYAIHVFILPGITVLLVIFHIALFRRHGQTPHWRPSEDELNKKMQPFWPDQMFRDMCAMGVAFAILVGINLYTHGVELGAPADPSSAFDARPEWYFRFLFQALKYFEGTMEHVVALGLPVVYVGMLLMMPFIDRTETRNPLRRKLPQAGLFLLMAGTILLTWRSFDDDRHDQAHLDALVDAEDRAVEAREAALAHGVPPAGGTAVFRTEPEPFELAKTIWAEDCAGCHADTPDRKGPLISYGYNSRAWIKAFLTNPSDDKYFGVTEIDGMEPVELTGVDLDTAVEFVYAQTGAPDADRSLADKGKELFDGDWGCTNCHEAEWDSEGGGAPTLAKRGTVEMLAEFIGNPAHDRWFGDKNEMDTFYDKYNLAERTQVAEYLVWLRTAQPPAKAEPKAE